MPRFIVFLTLLSLALGDPTQALGDTPLTVMTYNIRAGLGVEGNRGVENITQNFGRIADTAREAGADVIFLQEVDRTVERTSSLDEAALLAEMLGMNHAFAPAIDLQGGEYGIALLSRWDIEEIQVIPLFQPDFTGQDPPLPDYYAEQRVALLANLASGEKRVTAVNTHLGLTRGQRMEQLREIAAVVDEISSGSAVVFGGDLNCEPDAPELLPIRALLRDCYQGFISDQGLEIDIPIAERLTFHATDPTRCIDYLFVSPGTLEVLSTEVLSVEHSDHRPVVTRLLLR